MTKEPEVAKLCRAVDADIEALNKGFDKVERMIEAAGRRATAAGTIGEFRAVMAKALAEATNKQERGE